MSELAQANLQWLKQIQGSVFADEVTNLRAKGNRLPLVRQLRLFLTVMVYYNVVGASIILQSLN